MCHKNYIFSKYLLLEKHKLSHNSQNWVIYPIMQNMLIVNPSMVVAVNIFFSSSFRERREWETNWEPLLQITVIIVYITVYKSYAFHSCKVIHDFSDWYTCLVWN